MAGCSVLITFGFFIYIVSWDRAQLVGLNISLRSIVKASYARHCRNTNDVRNSILMRFFLLIVHTLLTFQSFGQANEYQRGQGFKLTYTYSGLNTIDIGFGRGKMKTM